MTTSYRVPPDLAHARSLVLDGLGGYAAQVFHFGSFARGTGGPGSDIDIGVLPLEPIPADVLSGLRSRLEDSRLLYPVELIDLSEADSAFRDRVVREGVRWDESTSA
jgi:predicted nucleotidyltransferase